MVVDRYYSSEAIADQLAEFVPVGTERIFDPAMGEGALLDAVQRRLGDELTFLGADLDPRAVKRVRQVHPDWRVGLADAWDERSIARSPVWREAQNGKPVHAVLNPPFSFRGGSGQVIAVDGVEARISPAIAFVVQLVTHIPALDGLLAILPEGALHNLRDQPAWSFLREQFSIDVLHHLSVRAFTGVTVNTAIVQFVKGAREVPTVRDQPSKRVLGLRCVCVDVVRGRFPYGSTSSGRTAEMSIQVVHSTNLRGPAAAERFGPATLATTGAALLIPRVGPSPRARVREIAGEPFVLSDCVLALRPRDIAAIGNLRASIVDSLSTFEGLYRGTGARHLTVAALLEFLNTEGWLARHVGASEPPAQCECATAPASVSPS